MNINFESLKKVFTLWRLIMKNEEEQISEGLNQIFEIINAQGDVGELKEIVDQSTNTESETLDQKKF
jgi:hypothetical protein